MYSIEVTLDYEDVEAAAAFWMEALGYEHRTTRPPYIVIGPPRGSDGPAVVLQQVPNPAADSRVHLDLRVDDQAATVERLVRLGATVTGTVDEGRAGWTVMADPWGVALCVCAAR